MKHHKATRTLSRVSRQRKALLRSLARSLVINGSIKTTEAKAKELRPYVERLVTHAKKNSLASTRHIEGQIGTEARKKISQDAVAKYMERMGGYTRITKLPYRKSDGASMAIIEFV